MSGKRKYNIGYVIQNWKIINVISQFCEIECINCSVMMKLLTNEGWCKMTKKDLINALEGLDDDAQVLFYGVANDYGLLGEYAVDVYFDDKVTGDDVQNEISIVAHF